MKRKHLLQKYNLLKRTPRHQTRTAAGVKPGVIEAVPEAQETVMTVMAYDSNEKDILETVVTSIDEVAKLAKKWNTVWLNITGLKDVDAITTMGKTFAFHDLAMEDVMKLHQRPKAEDYKDHTYIVVRMPHNSPEGLAELEQVSMFIKENLVITIQEHDGDSFERIRERLREGKGRIRGTGAEYLAYVLIDATVDSYFPILDAFADNLDSMEDDILNNPSEDMLQVIYTVKTQLQTMRRSAWFTRDMLSSLLRDQNFITEKSENFWRDCYDHAIQIMDMAETFRERASGMTDLYMSAVSHKMNEGMKVLTLFATIFMPLGFLAGIYGMNFNNEVSEWNMPELQWAYGYPTLLGVMVLAACGMIAYFRIKGWIGK
ncbi:MAG: magnesium and cobalt transport protein CorA [Magnetococcales bacterium]|nr:magnesium and cobalt transport protein CorA [Magnetococcales bacterium]